MKMPSCLDLSAISYMLIHSKVAVILIHITRVERLQKIGLQYLPIATSRMVFVNVFDMVDGTW